MKTQPLSLADLEKRSSELDLREEFIERREELFNIPAKTEQLKAIQKQIETQQQVLAEQTAYKEAEIARLENKITSLQADSQQLSDSIQKTHTALRADLVDNDRLKQKNAELEANIVERQAYQDNQEASIDLVAKEANDRLNEMRFEADNIEARKYKALEDITRQEQENIAVAAQATELEDRLTELTRTYEERAKEYRDKLQELDNTLVNRQADIDTRVQLIQVQVAALEGREKAIRVKEAAQNERAKTLDGKEKFLRSRYHLDGKDYDN